MRSSPCLCIFIALAARLVASGQPSGGVPPKVGIAQWHPTNTVIAVSGYTTGPLIIQSAENPDDSWLNIGFVFGSAGYRIDTTAGTSTHRFYRAFDAASNVYSMNIVGFTVSELNPGLTPLVAQFGSQFQLGLPGPGLPVNVIFPSLPAGLSLYRTTLAGHQANTFTGNGWTQGPPDLQVGEGFLCHNPTASNLQAVLVGNLQPGILIHWLEAGMNLCGSMVPVVVTNRALTLGGDLGYPAQNGDQVYVMDTTNQAIRLAGEYDESGGGWMPSDPGVNSVSEGYWIHKTGRTTWQRLGFGGCGGYYCAYTRTNFVLNATNGAINFFTAGGSTNQGRIYDVDGLAPVGSSFRGQLYCGTNSDESTLAPVGSSCAFLPGSMAGFLNGGLVNIPGFLAWGQVNFQLRAWNAAEGTSFEAALLAGGATGRSEVFKLSTSAQGDGAPTILPLAANAFKSFQLIRPPPPTLQQLQFNADGTATFNLPVLSGYRVIVEAASDLGNWTTLINVVPSTSTLTVNDPASAAASARFYRVSYALP